MPDIFKTYNCSLLPFNFTVTKEGIVTLGAKEGMDTIIRGLKERHYIGALMPHFRGLPYDLLFRVRPSYSVQGNTYQ